MSQSHNASSPNSPNPAASQASGSREADLDAVAQDTAAEEAREPLDDGLLVHLGRMDKDIAYAVQRLALPLVPLKTLVDVAEGFKTARALGQGVVISGPRGVGKSYAVRHVRRVIEAAERVALALNPEDHPLTRVLYVPRLTGRTIAECAVTMLDLMVKGFRDREMGIRMKEDKLLPLLSKMLDQKHYQVIIIDEIETATSSGIELARRLLPEAEESNASGEAEHESDLTAGETASPRALILVGTQEAADQLAGSEDANGRWARFVRVEGLTTETAATVYETVFPGFHHAIEQMGRPAWMDLLATQIVRGRRLSMRQVANHCRWYFATVYEASRAHATSPEQMILRREAVPFDQVRFLYCFNTLNTATPRVSSGKAGGRKGKKTRSTAPQLSSGGVRS
jgi:hypothetical protein